MDEKKESIGYLLKNGIAASKSPVRNGEDYRLVAYTNKRGERKVKLVDKDAPHQEGWIEFDPDFSKFNSEETETSENSAQDETSERSPANEIEAKIDEIIRENAAD